MLNLLRKLSKTQNFVCHLCTIKQTQKTAAVIIIGDEILKGDVIDTNSQIIIPELYKLGVRLKTISIIGDDVQQISNEVKRLSNEHTYVITSGGIGPTHDDVTYEGVAKAFDQPLKMNEVLRKMCEDFFKTTDVGHPGMKLAKVPAGAKLRYSKSLVYPNVSVNNVFIFPGVPQFFVKTFQAVSKEIFLSDSTFYKKNIHLNSSEHEISDLLSKVAVEYPNAQIGSYPQVANKAYKIRVQIETTNEKILDEVVNELLKNLDKKCIVYVD